MSMKTLKMILMKNNINFTINHKELFKAFIQKNKGGMRLDRRK